MTERKNDMKFRMICMRKRNARKTGCVPIYVQIGNNQLTLSTYFKQLWISIEKKRFIQIGLE